MAHALLKQFLIGSKTAYTAINLVHELVYGRRFNVLVAAASQQGRADEEVRRKTLIEYIWCKIILDYCRFQSDEEFRMRLWVREREVTAVELHGLDVRVRSVNFTARSVHVYCNIFMYTWVSSCTR